jgi:tRNA modification GTPase
MTLPNLADTIAALATPPGVGAIAVLRLSGPRAVIIADSIFRGKRLENQPSHTAHFGRIEDEAGRALDEVVATIFRAPKSYTGEELVEISVHGSPYIQQEVLQLLLRRGARLAQPGEFTLRAFLNGKMDLSQAEAVADLIVSQSAAAHTVALRQLRGGFKTEIAHLREELVHFASLVELELDFSEEDVVFADRAQLKNLVHQIRQYIGSLLRTFQLGNALRTGVATVIAGRPNAGKSTLLNALLNEERAIVSEIAGTTRDTIEEVLNIGGVQFRLIDTAGIREAQDAIEALGVQRTMEKIEEAAIVVYVWDVAAMTIGDVYRDLEAIAGGSAAPDSGQPQGPPLLVVCNKMDKVPYFKTDWLLDPTDPDIPPFLLGDTPPSDHSSFIIHHSSLLPVSAKNQMNIEYLKEKLFELVVGEDVNLESTVVTNARHYAALQQADESLADVLTGLDTGVTGDFVAMDIRRALNYLGEITGEIGVEDLLGNIFGKFCIGK